ncbi:MAG TPA: beta-N-acetylhexosaminidase [Actinophytocola sp.]|uniref:beta-N-acetylhexosaminidase n=1 Tax=Actinophytocola sp. TaxID=1872138 RepID=UPI002DDCB78F|nr:beta-N-acetylhexosaminidase [Actinophytocola sp.]HEV2780124.1 beta-N-acetylhexosaminidase [Actinophytocola sp.]
MTGFDGLLPRPVRLARTDAVLPPEGYRLMITPDSVHVDAADDAGAFYAEQTLRQLRGPDAFRAAALHSGPTPLPCGVVEDYPRFAWRGCLLDVARHFMPKAAVLRFIDLLAVHKLNVLHLHLTDDQGWRLEVPELPLLTSVGAWRAGSWVGRPPDGTVEHDGRPHGGYYTTTDLREIVAYAAARHVTVVPEVDIPGHSRAAIAAYPALGVDGAPSSVWTRWGISETVLSDAESTIEFYRRVFSHVVDVFPAKVICLGGDEASGGRRLVTEIAAHLIRLGRRPMGWDDLLAIDDLPPEMIIGCWRSAAVSGHDVIACPERYLYLDHRQSDHPDEPIPVGYVTTVADVYGYEPPPGALGAQAAVWTEHLDSPRSVDYAAFPRLAAFAEVVWSPAPRDYPEFETRLAVHHLPRLDALGVEYRPLTGPHPWQTRPGVPGRPRYRDSS